MVFMRASLQLTALPDKHRSRYADVSVDVCVVVDVLVDAVVDVDADAVVDVAEQR
jgi:hypothetical protein